LEPFYLGLAADVRSRAGQHDAARTTLAAAFAALASSQNMLFATDLY
jgi:hypothetical protein